MANPEHVEGIKRAPLCGISGGRNILKLSRIRLTPISVNLKLAVGNVQETRNRIK